MSYEIYCYQSKLGTPTLDEAQFVVEEEPECSKISRNDQQEQIANLLIKINPRLEPFVFDYTEIANFQNISEQEAKELINYIELNTPEGEEAMQISIYPHFVAISTPYGSRLDDSQIMEYCSAISQSFGYFIYDPQTEKVWNPQADALQKKQAVPTPKDKMDQDRRPWWKFWQ